MCVWYAENCHPLILCDYWWRFLFGGIVHIFWVDLVLFVFLLFSVSLHALRFQKEFCCLLFGFDVFLCRFQNRAKMKSQIICNRTNCVKRQFYPLEGHKNTRRGLFNVHRYAGILMNGVFCVLFHFFVYVLLPLPNTDKFRKWFGFVIVNYLPFTLCFYSFIQKTRTKSSVFFSFFFQIDWLSMEAHRNEVNISMIKCNS